MTMPGAGTRFRGGPLVMLVLLLAGWSAGRAVWWENPFIAPAQARGLSPLAVNPMGSGIRPKAGLLVPPVADLAGVATLPAAFAALGWHQDNPRRSGRGPRGATRQSLMRAPVLPGPRSARGLAGQVPAGPDARVVAVPASAPFLPRPVAAKTPAEAGRWSADAWAFWRQGSDAAPISQGRVPIYGASQVGGVLQYRLVPASARDPRLYGRAYRALVVGGESELALGASLRPLPRIPLRVAGEVRYTNGAFSDTFRPAAYVVSELPPVRLPYGALLEAYGQAGWVGGPAATAFADGQASVTGEWRQIAGLTDNALRLSFGAAAWGGAQRDAQRIDIGPTLRLDMTVGQVPARLSVDWRERVGGDAGPDSGVAATISAGF